MHSCRNKNIRIQLLDFPLDHQNYDDHLHFMMRSFTANFSFPVYFYHYNPNQITFPLHIKQAYDAHQTEHVCIT